MAPLRDAYSSERIAERFLGALQRFLAEAFEDKLVLRGVAAWRNDPNGAPDPDYS